VTSFDWAIAAQTWIITRAPKKQRHPRRAASDSGDVDLPIVIIESNGPLGDARGPDR